MDTDTSRTGIAAGRRTVIVSGGTGGLGTHVVSNLLATGWHVVVPWIVEEELARLPRSTSLTARRVDLFDQDEVQDLVRMVHSSSLPPLTAVVNLVGGFAMGHNVGEAPIADFERMLNLNLRPLYLLTQAALPSLIESGGGAIVGVSARAASDPFAGASGYITAKAGVSALMSAIAVEYRSSRVRANVVVPSVIDTPANRAAQPDSSRIGWVSPSQIADTVSFLVSDAASAVTGAQIPVTG